MAGGGGADEDEDDGRRIESSSFDERHGCETTGKNMLQMDVDHWTSTAAHGTTGWRTHFLLTSYWYYRISRYLPSTELPTLVIYLTVTSEVWPASAEEAGNTET